MTLFYVYEHWRTDKNEPFYVGKGKKLRAYNMTNRNSHHKSIQAKIYKDGFAIEVRIIKSGMTEDDAFALECDRIKMWKDQFIDLANKTNGGEGTAGFIPYNKGKPGKPHTNESKEKIRSKLKGRPAYNKGKPSPLKGKKGHKQTEETRIKISKSGIGRPPWNKGLKIPLSEETKQKISISNKGRLIGRLLSEETKLKMSESQKARWLKNKDK